MSLLLTLNKGPRGGSGGEEGGGCGQGPLLLMILNKGMESKASKLMWALALNIPARSPRGSLSVPKQHLSW